MTKQVARRVHQLRTGPVQHSLRRIAEVICEEHPDYIIAEYGQGSEAHLHGNQLLGYELVSDASIYLGETFD